MQVLDVLAGEKEDSEKRRRTIRAALFEGARKGDESLAQYALHRESQIEMAGKFLSLGDDAGGTKRAVETMPAKSSCSH